MRRPRSSRRTGSDATPTGGPGCTDRCRAGLNGAVQRATRSALGGTFPWLRWQEGGSVETRRTITQPPEPPGPTQAYEGDPVPAKASGERPRVALVAGPAADSSADLAQLLRERLLIIAVAGAIVFAADRASRVPT